MQFIAHRGYWKSPDEKNSKVAFERALGLGFGIETDFRDLSGTLVISHDPPIEGAMLADDFFSLYKSTSSSAVLAINVKSDGLQDLIKRAIDRFNILNYFVFDMSVPDSRRYFDLGLEVYTRRSEYEAPTILDERAAGAWLDCFLGSYVSDELLHKSLVNDIDVALVSPELHGKPHVEAWAAWRSVIESYNGKSNVSICTDFPEKAKAFFYREAE